MDGLHACYAFLGEVGDQAIDTPLVRRKTIERVALRAMEAGTSDPVHLVDGQERGGPCRSTDTVSAPTSWRTGSCPPARRTMHVDVAVEGGREQHCAWDGLANVDAGCQPTCGRKPMSAMRSASSMHDDGDVE